MATTISAKKRILQHERNRQRNVAHRSKMRTFVRKVEEAIAAKDHPGAREIFRQTAQILDKMVTKGIIHKNNAARRKSRLNARIKALVVQ